jgi:DNA processing protein
VAAAIAAAAGRVQETLDRIAIFDLAIVTLDDPDYPARLLAVELPPPVLFVQGSAAALSSPHAVAVVGTRRPTETGRRIASRIAAAISRSGGVVVSGLALGIDGAAHAAAVGEHAPTVAVLGGGHAQLFPRAHVRLAAAIVEEGGAVVAELPPDYSPTPGTFPRRNRLISGLADAAVVVEAGLRSGALITAGWALEQGRECFLVPGSIDSPMSAGCLRFLWTYPGQARIVAGVPELLADLGLTDDESSERVAAAGVLLTELGAVERALIDRLLQSAATVDDLVGACRLPVATVLGGLTLLEMRGLVSGAYGRYRAAGPLAETRR